MMGLRGSSFVVFVAAVGSVSAGGTRGSIVEVQPSDLSPSLQPKSDKTFFRKDYPDDLRPEVVHRFNHPYPTVQDDDDYDKDFVQDENHDNGEWTAQMEYDALKTRLQREKAEMYRAKQKMDEEKRGFEAIAGKEAKAERETEALEERAEKVADEAADAKGSAGESERQASGDARDVEHEMDDLKHCEEDLRKAKEELKRLLQQVKAADKASGAAADKADDAEAESVEAEKTEAVWEDKVTMLDQIHQAAASKYQEKLAELKTLEGKLADAAKKLAKFRASQMDANGAVVADNSGDAVAFHSSCPHVVTHPVAAAVFVFVCMSVVQ